MILSYSHINKFWEDTQEMIIISCGVEGKTG